MFKSLRSTYKTELFNLAVFAHLTRLAPAVGGKKRIYYRIADTELL